MTSQAETRMDYLITLCHEVLATQHSTEHQNDIVKRREFNKFRAAGLSFFSRHFGEEHPYFKEFASRESNYAPSVEGTLGILEAVKEEISHGWHKSPRGVVSAEVFSDFIEMATHLLQEGYKDAAAVMLGSTLEEHLRQLCRDSSIPITAERDGKTKPKKAETLNSELAKAGVYTALDQKSVTAWLAVRNSSAHGKYDDYSMNQVQLLASSLSEFMVRTRGDL